MTETKPDANEFDSDEIIVKDEKVSVLRHARGNVYLLGSHHNRRKSALAVQELLRIVKPHIVAVELCRTNLERFSVADKPTKPITVHPPRSDIDSDKYLPYSSRCPHTSHMAIIPARLKDRAVGEELLLGLISESIKYDCFHLNRKRFAQRQLPSSIKRIYRVRPKIFHDVVIGLEMTVPFGDYSWQLEKGNSVYLYNPRVPYKIMLADKPLEETFCSVAAALSDEERTMVRVYRENFIKLFVEFSTNKSIVMNMLEKNPKLYKAIVKDRDEYMAKSIRTALEQAKIKKPNEQPCVVGIVGKNHVAGIAKYWKKHLSTYRLYRPATTAKRSKRANSNRKRKKKDLIEILY